MYALAEPTLDAPDIQPKNFGDILTEMNLQGNFSASVLAGDDGLPIAYAPAALDQDADAIAALVAMVKGFLQNSQTQMNLARLDEMSIVIADHQRLVCRYFEMDGNAFMLALVAQANQPYRRLSTHTIQELKRVWN